MAKRWNRMETWIGLIVLGIGGVIMAVAGLWIYVSATTVPLHPEAANVPTVVQSHPSQQWTDAVERARQAMRAGVTEQNLPGLSVAVAVGGEIVWAEGFGWANLEKQERVTPGSRFRIGTASAMLTSAAAGLLIENQRLKLDEQIQTYVPEFPRKEWPVTVRQVMAHTAGIASDGGDEGPLFSQNCDRPVEALRFFADRSLRFEPDAEYRFSNFGWIVMSAAIESASGEPFLIFMRKEIFEPLGMDDTIPESATDLMPNQATSYFPRFAADTRYGPDPMRPLNLSCYSGAGVFLSTPSDLVRFVSAINAGKLLQPATVALLQANQRLRSGQETGYGLGWDLESVTLKGEQTRVAGHDGDVLGGIVGSVMAFRERGMVIAAIANTSYADTPALVVKIAEVFAK